MAGIYSMKEQLSIADLGVRVVTDYLERQAHIIKVVNVESNKEYQKKDIDLLACMMLNKKKLWVSIEVKCDTYKSGNMYIETISNKNKNTPGCIMYSDANYLFYYFEKLEKLYIIPMKKFREWFKENRNRFNRKNPSTKTSTGKVLYESEGYTVPLQIIEEEFTPLKVIPIKNVKIFNREVI